MYLVKLARRQVLQMADHIATREEEKQIRLTLDNKPDPNVRIISYQGARDRLTLLCSDIFLRYSILKCRLGFFSFRFECSTDCVLGNAIGGHVCSRRLAEALAGILLCQSGRASLLTPN